MTAQDLHPPGKYRLRIADYVALAEAGAFQGLRTELIEGDVIVMSPQFRPHGMVKQELYDRLRDALRALGSRFRPVTEFSLAIDDHNLPAPDVLLTSEPMGEGAVPLASVALVIEVAGTTLADDLGAKARLYARARIPEYWVADVKGRVVHQLWSPGGKGYGGRREVAFGESLVAETIEGLVAGTAGL